MRASSQQTRIAQEAVAQHFSATSQHGTLRIGRNQISLVVRIAATNRIETTAKPRLRFDRVVFRVIGNLRRALAESIPDGKTVVFTMTAPIRVPGKTVAMMEARIRALLEKRAPEAQLSETIHGNQIQVRVVKGRAAKVIGFVHNPGCDPNTLLDAAQAVLACTGPAAKSRSSPGDRWLVITDETSPIPIEAYPQVYAQLTPPNGFKRVLLLVAGNTVVPLAG